MDNDTRNLVSLSLGGVVLLGATVGGLLWGCPQYNVYSARKSGEAVLAEAQSSRLAKVAEAKARFESAQFDAKAEVERAKGTKDANNIVISSFGSTEERLRYLEIEMLKETKNQVIYIPSDGVMPIQEAGRRSATAKK